MLYDILLQYLKQNSFNREYTWPPLRHFSSTRMPFVSTALKERGGELFEPIVSTFSLKSNRMVPSHLTRWQEKECANKLCQRENKVCSENIQSVREWFVGRKTKEINIDRICQFTSKLLISVDCSTSKPGKTVNTECGSSVVCKLQTKSSKTLFKAERALIQRDLPRDLVVKERKTALRYASYWLAIPLQ